MIKQVLGVRIDDVSEQEALEKVENAKKGFLVFTPGPEFLVTASKDKDFKEILNKSDLNVPDGFGLHFAGVKNRIPGVDLMLKMCELASNKDLTVGLIGGHVKGSGVVNVAELASATLHEKFPKLKIKFAYSDEDADKIMRHYLVDNTITISFDDVDMLFIGLGHPKQEKLLLNIVNSKEKRGIKFGVGMGVGGSFDLIAGTKKRAPKLIRQLGLEWLWRALSDPKHFVRVWRAIVEFGSLYAASKL